MGDWQQYLQSVIFGLIFSFLLAKLFSIIFAFRDENLRITRGDVSNEDEPKIQSDDTNTNTSAAEPLIQSNNDVVLNESSDSDDDWEGVESTELDEAFSAATAFVAATAADRSHKVSNEVQLQLYGLYKIATEGPCTASQPSALKMTARAKWNAWQKLGTMPPEEAMEKYLDIVTELYPSWLDGSANKKKGEESSGARNADSRGPMGPVFSTFISEEESENELKLDEIHAFAREGDEENLLKCIESGVPVNVKDSEGRAPLHWAVDRGHLSIAKLLLSRNADVNAKDLEGQTALHYAAVCEREDIAEFLVKHGADVEIKDNEGDCPRDVCELHWPWLQQATAHN
ncbi:acyl-CoA-binding domain-containing protein 1-like [Lycium ferocissimum]|uniref:acyl-CoA-binding domain-containing protein 1-like n=1 Tax=Lycium ferocissimum TaxID=112874 RepID=UPI002814C806|nr:acyl-CoA-binding domain-containing protein 1-like [Lycium ferocissimum]XP_059304551.1 acyl-CoA-binding domain-containing protein 1-like [Lycium ferocissimum]